MAEHLDTNRLSLWSTDILFDNLFVYFLHLIHVQLACQYGNISKLSVELQGVNVRDVQLCREVNLNPHLTAIHHYSNVTGDDSGDICSLGSIDNLVHSLNILAIDDSVYSQISLYSLIITGLGNLLEVVDGEVVSRMGTHIQLPDTEVNRVSSGIDGSCE